MSGQFTLPKSQKLKSRKLIEAIFEQGSSVNAYPFKVFYHYSTIINEKYQVGFSVSKRNFRSAVDRNRIKRLMREGFRLQQAALDPTLNPDKGSLTLMLVYIDRSMPDQTSITKAMSKVFTKLAEKHAS